MFVGIAGVTVTVADDSMVVASERPLTALSSAVVGGGTAQVRHVFARRVSLGYRSSDPESDLVAFARDHGITEPFVGLMTAVPMADARIASLNLDGLAVAAIVTAGLGNLAAPGLTAPAAHQHGTINLIILVDADLTPAAMVNAVTTATEVKASVLMKRGARTAEGYRATGTSTDAIVVACTGEGAVHRFAGPVTPVGWLVARCVRVAIEEALGVDAQA